MRRACAKDSKVSSVAKAGHASSSERSREAQAEMDDLGGLGLKTTVQAYFLVWPQNRRRVRCSRIGKADGTWRHRETSIETKRTREGGVSIRCFYKNMDCFAFEWAVTVVISVGVF